MSLLRSKLPPNTLPPLTEVSFPPLPGESAPRVNESAYPNGSDYEVDWAFSVRMAAELGEAAQTEQA